MAFRRIICFAPFFRACFMIRVDWLSTSSINKTQLFSFFFFFWFNWAFFFFMILELDDLKLITGNDVGKMAAAVCWLISIFPMKLSQSFSESMDSIAPRAISVPELFPLVADDLESWKLCSQKNCIARCIYVLTLLIAIWN